jgi:hypothetical protein
MGRIETATKEFCKLRKVPENGYGYMLQNHDLTCLQLRSTLSPYI